MSPLGDVECVQGGLPPVGPPLAALPGRVQAHDRQVQALHRGLLGREVAAGLHRATEPAIDRLDGICRADDGPYFPVEPQERHEFRPGVLPEPYDSGVALFPFAAESGEPVQRLGFGRRGVNGLEVLRDLRPVPLRGVLERIPQKMDDTRCTIVFSQTVLTASGRPLSPSQASMHTSRTPRFLISDRTRSQNLAPSPSPCSPAHSPKTSRSPSTV